ncbi:hypothetical protein KIH39_17390 [Telmatocola sphagniphila]|uniref:Lipoprotein n=1 Tax=Telmatocola sphagniphila TaxID=1123043 RepID=A0A8E6B588_9BACT|nr:hypothetical protein [Telmatocola sphagniphila]QVL30620.1 hypothetical protein KIH39_17390 [Telmatocola sphagniphila]
MSWLRKSLMLLAVALVAAPIGCAFPGPFTPIPVQPWTSEKIENQYLHKNDFRTPIMPPIREGFPPPLCEDEPSVREVLRAMPSMTRGVPYVIEEFRDDVRVAFERIVDKIDPPRFFPLIGPAQLHHCHWKCTVYFTETIQSDYPFPVKLKKRRVEVMYIDKDHLHQYVGPDVDVQRSITKEHTGY